MSVRLRAVLVALLSALPLLAAQSAAARHVNLVVIDGSINPASADHVLKAIAQSESDGAAALLIELDTPGGLLAATKDIVQGMLGARVPIIVYVAPAGAWAASAGAFITLAANIAAMAPGTSIGAASPISASGSGGERDENHQRQDVAAEKAEKFTVAFIESIAKERHRNVEWAMRAVREAEAVHADAALELGVIDLIARSRDALFEEIEGREIEIDGEKVTIAVVGAEVRTIEMDRMTRLFNFLASPDIAVLFVMAGLLGLYLEFNQPGMIVPGVAGVLCLILAGFAFQILPFSWVGLVVMLLGLGMVAAELFVPSYGVLFALGIGCFLFGGSTLFDMPELNDLSVSFWSVLVPAVAGFALFAGVVIVAVGRSLGRAQTAGVSEMIGKLGRSDTALTPDGRIFVRGEYWNATADEEISSGDPVEVTAVEGMRLRVRRPRG